MSRNPRHETSGTSAISKPTQKPSDLLTMHTTLKRLSKNTTKQPTRRLTFSWMNTRLKSLLCSYLSLYLLYAPLQSVAGVTPDGSTHTAIDRAPNGTEVVNIARQNRHGVSINHYQRFNVDPSGLILNNSDRVGTSKLAGVLYANPHFRAGDGASLILNQVTSDEISHLYGYTEVFGKNAAFILANPNGIYAKGAGFINTNDVSLITGIAHHQNGRPHHFEIGEGKLLIEGAKDNLGIDARGANYLRLISRVQDLRGDIQAGNHLEIQAGNAKYDYDQHLIHSIKKSTTGDPAIHAIGSMYAGHIRLVSTEKGLGVHTDNTLIAKAGELEMTADGKLIYKNALAKGDIRLKADAITATKGGKTYTEQGNIHLTADGTLNLHHDIISAKGDLHLNSQHLITHAESTTDGGNLIAHAIDINATHSTLTRSLIADTFKLKGHTAHINAHTHQNSTATLTLHQLTNLSQLDINALTLNTTSLDNRRSGMLHDRHGKWQLNITHILTNHGTLWLAKDKHLHTQTIHNHGTLGGGGDLTLSGTTLNNHGKLSAEQLTLNHQTIRQGDNGHLIGKRLHLTGNWQHASGSITSAEQLTLNSDNLTLATTNWFRGPGAITLNITHTFTNYTTQHAAANLNLHAHTIDNRADLAFNRSTLTATTLKNTATLFGKHRLNVRSQSRDASLLKGTLRSDGELDLTLAHGLDYSTNGLKLITGRGSNHLTLNGDLTLKKDFQSRGNLTLNIANLNTHGKMLAVQQNLTLNGQHLTNHQGGYLYAGGMMDLDIDRLTNQQDATLYSGGHMTLHKDSTRNTSIHNQAGNIKSRGKMTLRTHQLVNRYAGDLVKKTWENKTIHYTTWRDTNRGQWTYPWGASETQKLLTEKEGQYHRASILSQGDMKLDFGHLDNQHSIIRTASNLTLEGEGLTNQTQKLFHEIWYKKRVTGRDRRTEYDDWNNKYSVSRTVEYEIPHKATQVYASFGGKITAAGTISGNLQRYGSGNTQGEGLAHESHANPNPSQFTIVSGAKQSGRLNPLEFIDTDKLKRHTLSRLGGAYRLAAERDPNSLYLIESRTRFTDEKAFIASAYFFKHMGFDPHEADVSLFADAWSEQQLIRDSIAQLGHTTFLQPGITSMDEQLKQLYDNAIELAEGLNLKIGVKLTHAQITALRKDIIWYERHTINGQRTLVPQIYLSKHTRGRIKLHQGSLLAADELELEVKQHLENGGTIYAEDTLVIEAKGDIHNIDGHIHTGKGDLWLTAAKIINQTRTNHLSWLNGKRHQHAQAGIRSGGNMSLKAHRLDNIGGLIKAKGDALIDAKAIHNQSTVSGYDNPSFARTGIDGVATIDSGGTLMLKGGQFTDTGGHINTGKHFITDLKGKMTFHSIALKTNNFSREDGWEVHREKTRHHVSRISVGGTKQWQAGGDVTLQGTQSNVKGETIILTEGNYTQQSLINTTRESRKKSTYSANWIGGESEERTEHRATHTHQGSHINSGKGLIIRAGGNLNLIASTLKNKHGKLHLKAGKDLNLISGVNGQSISRSKQKTGNFTQSQEGSGSTHQQAAHFGITSGGGIIADAEGNINIIGGQFSAKETATIGKRTVLKNADGSLKTDKLGRIQFKKDGPKNINIQAVKLNNKNYSYKKEGYTGVLGDLAKGLVTAASLVAPLAKFDLTLSKEERQHHRQSVAEGTAIKANQLNAMANNTMDLEGVALAITDTAYLKADDVTLRAAKQTESHHLSQTRESVGSDGASLSSDEITVASTYRQKDSHTQATYRTSYKKSTIQAGRLIIDADQSATLNATDLAAKDATLLGDEVTLTGINESETHSQEKRTEKESFSIGIKNAYVDTAKSTQALAQATQALAKAKDALAQAQKDIQAGKRDPASLDDFKVNLAAATAQVAQLSIQVAKNGAKAGANTANAGFYGSASLTKEEHSQRSKNTQQAWKGSHLNVNNLTIRAKNKTQIRGATIDADSLEIDSDKLELLSGISHNHSSHQSEEKSATANIDSSGDVNGSLSLSQSQQQSHGTHHTLSRINANNIRLKAKKGTIKGATIIGKHTNVDINDLTLASVQNTEHSQGSGSNHNLGVGSDAIPNRLGAGKNHHHSQRTWTDEQTQLIGTKSIRVKAKKLHNQGALIANATLHPDGTLKDKGNLDWQVANYSEHHLNNSDKSNASGFNANISPNGKDKNGNPTYGSTTLGAHRQGHDRQGQTLATIGKTQQGKQVGANQHLNRSQIITKDHQTGGLNASLSVDHRLLSKDGRQSIANDFEDVKDHSEEIATSLKQTAENEEIGVLDAFSLINDKAQTRLGIQEVHNDKATEEAINNADTDAKDSEESLENLAQALSGDDQLKVNLAKAQGKGTRSGEGYYDKKKGNIYVNVDKTDMTKDDDKVATIGHESYHHKLQKRGKDYGKAEESLAHDMGKRSAKYWNRENRRKGITANQTQTGKPTNHKEWLENNQNSRTVKQGTDKAKQVKDRDAKPVIDTVWDIANLAYDGGKALYALAKDDKVLLDEALTDLATDAVATAIPGIPAGTTKIARQAAKKIKAGQKLSQRESKAIESVVRAKKDNKANSTVRTHEPVPAPKNPKEITGFPGLVKDKRKTPIQGGGGLRKRWKDKKGNIYEWDNKKGELEKYDKTGKKHLGGFDPKTGRQISPAKSDRRVEK